MAAIAAKAVAKRRAAGGGDRQPFMAPELPWRRKVLEHLKHQI
jgi:hypothetical protein